MFLLKFKADISSLSVSILAHGESCACDYYSEFIPSSCGLVERVCAIEHQEEDEGDGC